VGVPELAMHKLHNWSIVSVSVVFNWVWSKNAFSSDRPQVMLMNRLCRRCLHDRLASDWIIGKMCL